MLPLARLLGQSKINVPWDIPIADAQLSRELLRCTRMLVCHGFLLRDCRGLPVVGMVTVTSERGAVVGLRMINDCTCTDSRLSKSLGHKESRLIRIQQIFVAFKFSYFFSACHSNSVLKAFSSRWRPRRRCLRVGVAICSQQDNESCLELKRELLALVE
jgi:hypothetical protein